MTDDQQPCTICHRPGRDPVHPKCRNRVRQQLDQLPGLLDRLPYALIPGASGGGDRVSASRTAPLPLRLGALNLTAGGAPYGNEDGGNLPIGAWLEVWANDWRLHFDHNLPETRARHRRREQFGRLAPRSTAAEWALRLAGHNVHRPALGPGWFRTAATRRLLAAWLTAVAAAARRELAARERAARREFAQAATGIADPAAQEWAARWRDDSRDRILGHHRYLTTWLDQACDDYPYIAGFAASLRALVGDARQTLGDTSDLQYLGRCPEPWTDRASGTEAPCGASIWHDPYSSLIVCPRCGTETDQVHAIWLARRILDTWPIDRRRRYPRGLIEQLRLPPCVHCGRTVQVEWVDATERLDRERFWRPGRVTCPNGCSAERLAS